MIELSSSVSKFVERLWANPDATFPTPELGADMTYLYHAMVIMPHKDGYGPTADWAYALYMGTAYLRESTCENSS